MLTSHTEKTASPLLVVAYDEKARASIAASLTAYNRPAQLCATFCDAESLALEQACSGVLVDLATMIKAKAEEKIVAHTLTSLFPTLRVKTLGSMLIPMAMAGDAKQDSSLKDFISRSCAAFTPRQLRYGRRRDICIPTFIGTERGFSLNISWGGLFIADMNPERFVVGEEVVVTLPDYGLAVTVGVARIQRWGQNRPPGIGVQFRQMGQDLERNLFSLLRSDKHKDRDRLGG